MRPPQKKRKKEQRPLEVIDLESLKQLNLNAAGLDIGVAEIWACVREDRAEQPVRMFPTFTPDLHALADWLEACGVDTVAMEATGIYWIPIYEILESRGFEVYLVNAQHIKNVPCKKSDILDCQWLQQLHTYGLLQASFRPPEEICALRALVRHRDNLIRYRGAHVQHMQKALQLMNVQLTNVISDITGQTGMLIIRAIVAGERDRVKLAQFRHPRCRSSEDEIAKSLQGNYRTEHLFALRQALELYDFYNQQIQACDAQIEAMYQALPSVVDLDTAPLPPARPGRAQSANAPNFDLRLYLYQISGVDLTLINGIDVLVAQTVISEIGLDMSKWPTVKHFTSWLGLAPNNQVTGGKIKKSKINKTKNPVAKAFRMAAQSAGKSHSALGGFYRRLRAKHGGSKAIVATAHKIARMVYHMLKYRQAYVDPGQNYYEQKYRERRLKNLKRQAKELGLKLIPEAT